VALVKMGTTATRKKLFFNLRKAKSKISALAEGDLHPDQVKLIAKRLGVTDQDVVDMNRRLGGDASLTHRSATTARPANGRTAGRYLAPTRKPSWPSTRSSIIAARR